MKQGLLVGLLKMTKVCREIYRKLMKNKICHRSHTAKWSSILNESIEDSEWEAIYSVNFKCTIESKMRSFQYRLLLRIIPTNRFLFRCNSDRCFFVVLNVKRLNIFFGFARMLKIFGSEFQNNFLST